MTPASARGGAGGVIAYVLIIVLWGTAFMFMTWMQDFVTPMQVSLIRVASALIPVVLFAVVTRSLRLQHLRYLHHFFIMSVLSNSLYFWAIAAGTYRLDSSIAGALMGSIPIFTFVVSVSLLRSESFTVRKALGIASGATGVVLLSRPWDAGAVDLQGVALMLLAALMYGLSFAYARRFITPIGIPAAAGATYQMVLATITLVIVTPLDGIGRIVEDPAAMWGAIIGLGFLATGVTTVLYYVLVRSYGAVTAATTTYFAPLVAVATGVVIVGDVLPPLSLLALALLLTAAFLSRTRPNRPNTPPPAIA